MREVYFISGLGANEFAFMNLQLPGVKMIHLNWFQPLKKETIEDYAKRMSEKITTKDPIIVGLSLGGMVAVEMAKQVAIEKLILISAVKTFNEIPRWMRITGTLRLHKWVPIKSNRFTERADDRRMGIETMEDKNFVDHYRKNADPKYIEWAVDQIFNWKNTWIPENLFHIHGEKDRMFPLRNIKATHIIKEGTHIMILNKANEISACIEEILFADV